MSEWYGACFSCLSAPCERCVNRHIRTMCGIGALYDRITNHGTYLRPRR
jgi:hypothetical protein